MNSTININPVGEVRHREGSVSIQLDEAYRLALTNIDGFSHLQVIWWGHLADDPSKRNTLILEKQFRKAPERLGIFVMRSPLRPNPILISTVEVEGIDKETGTIRVKEIDAEHGSPVLDIKPYFRMERVRECRVPAWCDHWPEWHEGAAGFNWQDEMNTD